MIPGLPDYDDLFKDAFLGMCRRLGVDPVHLAGVGMNESGMSAKAHDPDGNASGLWQLMPDTARGLGWYADDCEAGLPLFRELTPTQQIPWFERYYSPYRGRLVSRAACYVATFMPADLSLAADPNATIVDKSESDPKQWRRGWAYSSNASFDENHDMKIQVFELEDAIKRATAGSARYVYILSMLGLSDVHALPPATPTPPDLGTALGQEIVLQRVGLYTGALDGIPGPLLRGAVVAFQRSRGLAPDGICGPLTRAALAAVA